MGLYAKWHNDIGSKLRSFPSSEILGRSRSRPTDAEGVVRMRARIRTALGLAMIVGLVALIPLGQATAGGSTTLNATLSGDAEVPGPGDSNGSGNAAITLDPVAGDVCFDLDWDAIRRPFAAHIHRGRDTVAGPVRVTLFSSHRPLPGTITAVQGCVRNVNSDLIDRIIANPDRFYVNVHNLAYEAGAIRGQLSGP